MFRRILLLLAVTATANASSVLSVGSISAKGSVTAANITSSGTISATKIAINEITLNGARFSPPVNGQDSGAAYWYSTNTTMAAPTRHYLRFNDNNLALATQMAVANTDANNENLGSWLMTWNASSSAIKGVVTLIKDAAPGNFAMYQVTARLPGSQSGWKLFAVTYVTSGGTLPANTTVRVLFSSTGDKGNQGNQGVQGNTGSAGRDSGLKFTYITNVGNTDPGAGNLKFNSGTWSSITALRISETDGDSTVVAALEATWDAATASTRSVLILRQDQTPGVAISIAVSGARTDNSGWKSFPVTILTTSTPGALPFTNGMVLKLQFADTGQIGPNSGLSYTYLTNTGNTNPGAAGIKFNSATFSSITTLRISETDGDSNNMAPLLALWNSSTSAIKSVITMRKDQAPANIWVFQITGARSDNGGWKSFPVTPITSGGSFLNNDVVRVTYAITGNQGPTGSQGIQGVQGIEGPKGGINSTFLFAYYDDSRTVATAATLTTSSDVTLNSVTVGSTGTFSCTADGTFLAPSSVTGTDKLQFRIVWNGLAQQNSERIVAEPGVNQYASWTTSAKVVVTDKTLPILHVGQEFSGAHVYTVQSRSMRCVRVA